MPRRKKQLNSSGLDGGYNFARSNAGGWPVSFGTGFGGPLTAYLSVLESQRAALDTAIDGLQTAIAATGGTIAAPLRRPIRHKNSPGATQRRARAKGDDSLRSFIIRVLQGKAEGMRVKDIAWAVQKAGYTTRSHNFGNQVAAALATMKNETARITRGVFRLKSN